MMSKSKKEAEAIMPTDWGKFRMIAYKSDQLDYVPHVAMVHPDLDLEYPVDVRIHSECLTGDLFHSQRCDCGSQLDLAMKLISESKGILIYLRQEGRGIGLINKLKAYNMQDDGMDTVEANLALGFEIDSRKYEVAIEILEDLGVKEINLFTNNPDKVLAFDKSSIKIIKRLPLLIEATENNKKYLQTKKDVLGHFFPLD